MRLMYSTALASALLIAGPALAAGDKMGASDTMEGATGITAPERSAAQLPGHGADAGVLSQNFASAGFQNWQEARDAHILRMQSGGQPVWVILMPDGFQVGAAEIGDMDSQTGDLAEAPGSALGQQDLPDVSEQAELGDMPERGEQADISETFESTDQPDAAEGPDLGGQAEQPDVAEAPELPEARPDVAEAPDLGEQSEKQDFAESPDLGEQGEQADIAEAPELGEQGFVGETEPEGFAAQIPGELRSDLEGAGFQQVESVEGADFFHAKTQDGRTAFIIIGDLGGAGTGFDRQPAPGLDQPAPGAAPDLPETTPGADGPQPAPGGMQQ